MFYKREFKFNFVNSQKKYLHYEDENICPICKANISPDYISSSLDTKNTASVFNYCRSCSNTFLTKYEVAIKGQSDSREFNVVKKIYSEPNRFKEELFDDSLKNLSGQFVKIYNQALAAEASELFEIAGIGYRKALEFLIKDFAIHEHPADEETIKSMYLSPCIKEYIEDDRIQTLAERSTWIGNDETHYVRKQEDRDVTDMKNFIKAAVYFIGMVLITEDAASMESKK